jgi:anti-sigma B factor antagonist
MDAARANVAATTRGFGGPVTAGAVIQLAPAGELDIATAPIFLGSLAAALDRRPTSLEVDLRRLTFIDVRCVGAIATASVRMERWGGTLAACRPDRGVRRMFELCGLAHLLMPGAPGVDAPRSRALPPGVAGRPAASATAREPKR